MRAAGNHGVGWGWRMEGRDGGGAGERSNDQESLSGFSGSVGDQLHSLLFLQPGACEDAQRWAEEEGSGKEEGNPHLLSLPQCPDCATLGEVLFFMQIPPIPGPHFGFEIL